VKQSSRLGTTQDQATRIWPVVGIILNDLIRNKSFKHLVDANGWPIELGLAFNPFAAS
jgi:hypothetical protein